LGAQLDIWSDAVALCIAYALVCYMLLKNKTWYIATPILLVATYAIFVLIAAAIKETSTKSTPSESKGAGAPKFNSISEKLLHDNTFIVMLVGAYLTQVILWRLV